VVDFIIVVSVMSFYSYAKLPTWMTRVVVLSDPHKTSLAWLNRPGAQGFWRYNSGDQNGTQVTPPSPDATPRQCKAIALEVGVGVDRKCMIMLFL